MSDMEDAVFSDVEGEKDTHRENKARVCHLTQETISQGLSLLCRTGTGLEHAFVKLDLKDKGLTDMTAISSFIHIRFLDLSKNHLTDLSPLASLTQLLWLKARSCVDNNAVSCCKEQPFTQMTYLQWLSMAVNRLTDVDGLKGPALESLNLTGNGIQRLNGLQGNCFANLVSLELRGNYLDSTDGINLPNLQRLYLAQNVIKCLEGLDRLERLTTLHLRDNQLQTLEGLSPNMKCLQYLNVRENSISDENALQCLSLVSKTLRALVISENPVAEAIDFRVNMLVLLPKLERLDKDPVSPEERSEALQRIKELQEEEMAEP
ncbi:uncharacterized protein V6R79_011805 [Siganus canaliculatus]